MKDSYPNNTEPMQFKQDKLEATAPAEPPPTASEPTREEWNTAWELCVHIHPSRLRFEDRKCSVCTPIASALARARETAPAEPHEALELIKPHDMVSWLNELNSNWAVCRNTRSFLEGQPSEYWKKFDAAMGEAFQLQVALMKLIQERAALAPAPAAPKVSGSTGAAKGGEAT